MRLFQRRYQRYRLGIDDIGDSGSGASGGAVVGIPRTTVVTGTSTAIITTDVVVSTAVTVTVPASKPPVPIPVARFSGPTLERTTEHIGPRATGQTGMFHGASKLMAGQNRIMRILGTRVGHEEHTIFIEIAVIKTACSIEILYRDFPT